MIFGFDIFIVEHRKRVFCNFKLDLPYAGAVRHRFLNCYLAIIYGAATAIAQASCCENSESDGRNVHYKQCAHGNGYSETNQN